MRSFNEVLLGDLCTFTQGVQIADKDTVKSHQKGYIRYIYIRDLFTDKYPVYVKDEYPKKVLSWGDIVMVNTGNTSGYVYRAKEGVLCNNAFKISVKENKNDLLDKEFLWVYLNSSAREQMLKRLFNPAGQPHVGHKNVAKLKLKLPLLPEQRKIAKILSTWDKAISTTEALIETSKQQKKALMQQLLTGKKRLVDPETGEKFDGEWKKVELGKLLDYKQPTPYLVKSTEYSNEYLIPVLTAGKTFILGYSNEDFGIFREELPAIIFDDFTTASKFVNFPFKAKSSAMKILIAKDGVSIKYVYEAMQVLNYPVGGHQRHWISIFANLVIGLPAPEEQQKIAQVLTAADKEIEIFESKLAHLKQEKKALMQQLLTGKRRVKTDEEEAA